MVFRNFWTIFRRMRFCARWAMIFKIAVEMYNKGGEWLGSRNRAYTFTRKYLARRKARELKEAYEARIRERPELAEQYGFIDFTYSVDENYCGCIIPSINVAETAK